MSIAGWARRRLHLDDGPAVTDDDRAVVNQLRAEVDEMAEAADEQTARIVGLARYFERVNDRNHLAERWRSAMRGG